MTTRRLNEVVDQTDRVALTVSLARFEEGAGLTNTSLVRFEGNAVFGIERLTAAVRIT